MKYWIQIILLLLLVSSCDYFKAPREPKAIARVGKSYLYESDIVNLVPKGTSKQDSIAIVKSFIGQWATKKLLFEAAEKNNIACMDMAITQAKLRAYEDGIYSDNKWFNNIQTANRLQKILKIHIESKIKELEGSSLDRYIIQVLKKDYSDKAWFSIVQKAKLLKDGQTN